MIKKKYLAFFTILTSVLATLIIFARDIKMSTWCSSLGVICWENYNSLLILLLLAPSLLIPSLISLKVHEATFKSWKKITLYFVIGYITIITLMPWSVGDEFAGFTKGALGLFLCIIYVIFSVIYLLVKKNKL